MRFPDRVRFEPDVRPDASETLVSVFFQIEQGGMDDLSEALPRRPARADRTAMIKRFYTFGF
jgi:hypothetical protein